MSASLAKRNYFIQLTLLTLALFGIGAGVLQSIFPEYNFSGYPFVAIYFFMFGIFQALMFEAWHKRAPGKLMHFYLVVKTIKLVFSIAFMLIYCIAVRENLKGFVLTFVAYYLIYMIHDTWFFFTYEVSRKQNNKKRK